MTVQYLFKKEFVIDFKFIANLQVTYRDLPYTPYSETCIRLFIINTSHQSDTLVTTDEITLTCHYHPKSIVYIRVHSQYYTFYECGQRHMTYIYPYSIILYWKIPGYTVYTLTCIHNCSTILYQNNFIILKILYSPLIHLFLSLISDNH